MVICDADMQYDPNDIVGMIDKVVEGWDVACAYKVVRRDPLQAHAVVVLQLLRALHDRREAA